MPLHKQYRSIHNRIFRILPCRGREGGVCLCSVSPVSPPRRLVLDPDSSSDTVGVDVLEFSEWSLVDGPPTPGMLHGEITFPYMILVFNILL